MYQYHSIGSGYNLKYRKINLTAGAYYQWAQLVNKQIFPIDYKLKKEFNTVLPNVMMMYKISNEKMLRVFYRTSNTSPTVDQLQEVYNVSNPLQISTGNADLKQDYSHNLGMRFANMNAKTNTSFFVMLGGTVTDNYIGNSTSIARKNTLLDNGVMLAQGGSLVKPINLNGYYNVRTFIVYGKPIKKIKSNYNINLSASYTETPSLINGVKNISTTPNASLGLGLSSSTNPKFDYTISSNTSYNISKNSLQTNLNQTYINQTSRLKLTVMPYKGLVVSTDVTHQYYNGLSSNFNQNYVLLNAGIGYKFFKNKAADVRLIAFDILKQNTSIARNLTETYIEDTKTKVLQRYFMLVFTYTFKTFKGKTPGSENEMKPWMMHSPGGMPPPGGRF
jgi:outer membrane receptor protein involved in Fe transport